MKEIPNITVLMKCESCGHEQKVESAGSYIDADGKEHRFYGSAYDFCDKCEGVPKFIGIWNGDPVPLNEDPPETRPGMRRLVYADVPIAIMHRVALVVRDEADLQSQLTKLKVALEHSIPPAKPVVDKKGKVISYPLNKDWDKS